MAVRVGIVPDRFAEPVTTGVVRLVPEAGMDVRITRGSPTELAVKLREGDLDAALLSPIDYAKQYSHCSILPDACMASKGESRAAVIVFHEQSRKLNSIAVDPGWSSEIVLAHLVLVEKYDIHPTIIPVTASVDESLQHADGVLLVGDAALAELNRPNTIDLVDEWLDVTDMPFVHGVWVVRDDALSEDDSLRLQHAVRASFEHLTPAHDPEYLSKFQYDLNDEVRAGVSEFFRMAFYYGILRDIPDIKLYRADSQEGSPEGG
jgi:predicted solute-binding protein